MVELNLNKKNEYVLQHGDILVSNYEESVGVLVKEDNEKYHVVVLSDSSLDLFETIHSESMPLESIKESFKLLKKHNEYKMTIDEL